MTPEKLTAAIADHAIWLSGNGGKRLDLSRANLSWANLSGANLTQVNLSWANLSRANLSWANLTQADLSRANLSGADLFRANLRDANLIGTIGNMREVKSMQLDAWPCVWWHPAGGEPMLAIGCQSHPVFMWRNADPDWIARMDRRATAWAEKYLAHVLATVDLSPAVMTSKAEGRS